MKGGLKLTTHRLLCSITHQKGRRGSRGGGGGGALPPPTVHSGSNTSLRDLLQPHRRLFQVHCLGAAVAQLSLQAADVVFQAFYFGFVGFRCLALLREDRLQYLLRPAAGVGAHNHRLCLIVAFRPVQCSTTRIALSLPLGNGTPPPCISYANMHNYYSPTPTVAWTRVWLGLRTTHTTAETHTRAQATCAEIGNSGPRGCTGLKKNSWCTSRGPHVLKLANVMTNPCLMRPHYISYVIKLRTQSLRSLCLL